MAVHTSQLLHAVDISDHHHAVVVVRLVLEVGGTHTVVEDENGDPLLVEYSRPKELPWPGYKNSVCMCKNNAVIQIHSVDSNSQFFPLPLFPGFHPAICCLYVVQRVSNISYIYNHRG